MGEDGYFDESVAATYDADAEAPDPAVVAATVDVLQGLAGGGRALELAIGAGRIAIPLAARDEPKHENEKTRTMVAKLRPSRVPGASA